VRRTQIPHDVFFDDDEREPTATEQQDGAAQAPAPEPAPQRAPEPAPEPAPAPAATTGPAVAPPQRPAPPPASPAVLAQAPTAALPDAEPKTPKVQVSVYLSREAARWLDAARLELQHDHGIKTTKSALADYAIRYLSQMKQELLAAGERGELERG